MSKIEINRYGCWWRGLLSVTYGLCRVGFSHDLGQYTVGINFWEKTVEINLLWVSITAGRLTPTVIIPHVQQYQIKSIL